MMGTKPKYRKPWANFWVERALCNSPAFYKLTGKSAQILMKFKTKLKMEKHGPKGHQRWVIANNGEIQFTYAEALSLGVTARQFTRAIDHLIRYGFLSIAHPGGFKRPALYTLSQRWTAWGTPEFVQEKRAPDQREHKIRAAKTSRAKRWYVGGVLKESNTDVGKRGEMAKTDESCLTIAT